MEWLDFLRVGIRGHWDNRAGGVSSGAGRCFASSVGELDPMNNLNQLARVQAANSAGIPLSRSEKRQVLVYFSFSLVLLVIASPHFGIIEIPLSFLLMERFHLSAPQLAEFRFWVGLPFYLSFLFGFARDWFRGRGFRDRTLFIISGLSASLVYLTLAFGDITLNGILIGMVLATSAYLVMSSAWHGLIAAVAQRHGMAGQLSTVWNLTGLGIGATAMLVGGGIGDVLLRDSLPVAGRSLFVIGCMVTVALALFGGAGIALVDGVGSGRRSASFAEELGLLISHRPFYPALIIFLIWNFSPGTQTVLQYYLANSHNASSMQWGAYNAIESLAFAPTLALFGYLCTRYPLRRLLWIATFIGVPQMVPLLFIRSAGDALIAAVPIGLMGGMAEAAYMALIMRSCPAGLLGGAIMLSSSLEMLVSRLGNIWGTLVYSEYGFKWCALASILLYSLIIPILQFVPSRVVEEADC